MKLIPLTRGLFATVDDEDFEYLIQWKWCANKIGNIFYAVRGSGPKKNRKILLMHRVIMKAEKGQMIDHKNGDGLFNSKKENLRFCTHQENMRNRKSNKNSTSKYMGVSFDNKRQKWIAQIYYNKKNIQLGVFDNEIDAAKKYNEYSAKFFGEFGKINII